MKVDMPERYRKFKRAWGTYYVYDTVTGNSVSLKTRDKAEAGKKVTDLCKASFVQRGVGPDAGNRGDKGDDSVVRNHWEQWIFYVAGTKGDETGTPLPYQWLWQRIQQYRIIVALGTIAEYGVLKVFLRMATEPRVFS